MYNELHEECGVFGVYSRDGLDVASLCYYGLYALHIAARRAAASPSTTTA